MLTRKKWVHQRKLANFIIDSGGLLRLSVPFMAMAVINICFVLGIRWQVLEALQRTELVGVENLHAMNTLLNLQQSVTAVGLVGAVLLSVVCFLFWVVVSHRVFGPTIPLRRHVRNLISGDYNSRIHLRNRDEFKPLAADLNRLAEELNYKSVSVGPRSIQRTGSD